MWGNIKKFYVDLTFQTSNPPFFLGTAVMAIFPNVYVAMVMISGMGIISMSISYCPYALLGQYHEIKEVSTHAHKHKFRHIVELKPKTK